MVIDISDRTPASAEIASTLCWPLSTSPLRHVEPRRRTNLRCRYLVQGRVCRAGCTPWKIICHHFYKRGQCRWGDQCRWAHDRDEGVVLSRHPIMEPSNRPSTFSASTLTLHGEAAQPTLAQTPHEVTTSNIGHITIFNVVPETMTGCPNSSSSITGANVSGHPSSVHQGDDSGPSGSDTRTLWWDRWDMVD